MAGPDGTGRNFAYLRELSTPRLEELLTMDFPSGREDEALIEAVIQELLDREDAGLPDVERAWADFQSRYNVPEGDGLSLYPPEEESGRDAPARPSKRRRPVPGRAWARTALAACIVLALLAALVPAALGYANLAEMVARWTDRSFSFSPGSGGEADLALLSKEPKERYSSLQEALEDYGITAPVLPSWMPERSVLSGISVQVAPLSKSIRIHAAYFNGAAIQIVRHFDPGGAYTYGKDGEPVEVYTVEKIDHYIFENGGQVQAVWRSGSLECAIFGEMSREDLKRMIRSIYEEEGEP